MKDNYVYAIDCGGTKLRVAVVKDDLDIIVKEERKVINDNPEKLYLQIKELLTEVYEKSKLNINNLGISICGVVNNNAVKRCGNLSIENHFDLYGKLNNDFRIKNIVIENDANASAALEAKYGSNSKYNDSIFLTISTGIGSGVVLNKKLVKTSMELGRTLIECDNEECEFEHFASGNGIVNLAKKYDLIVNNAIELLDLVNNKDKKALKVYDKWKALFVNGLYNMQMLFNVEGYALSGGFINNPVVDIKKIESEVQEKIKKWNLNKIDLHYSSFKNDVGILGGAALVL